MQDVGQNNEGLNQVLDFNFKFKILEQSLEATEGLSSSGQLEKKHDLVKSGEPLEIKR